MRIDVITTGRSDYGIYRPLLHKLASVSQWDVRLVVSGSHLSETTGISFQDILTDGFTIAAKIPLENASDQMLPSQTRMALEMGRATQGLALAYAESQPDLVFILGDRYEMFALASACVPLNIPLAHIHGGELSFGAIDDAFRHALTKMSHLHFASTDEYAKRICQMGEEPWRVTVSGAPSLDTLKTFALPSRKELERKFMLNLSTPPILVTYHSETRSNISSVDQFEVLLAALNKAQDPIVFTAPNMDGDYKALRAMLHAFVDTRENAFFVENFGLANYLAMLRESKAMIGNSSSGLIETPIFELPVLNIGKRQDGRVRGINVVDTICEISEIEKQLAKVLSKNFSKSLRGMENPYGTGCASLRIADTIQNTSFDTGLVEKRFIDVLL